MYIILRTFITLNKYFKVMIKQYNLFDDLIDKIDEKNRTSQERLLIDYYVNDISIDYFSYLDN